ncbi:hypothetical protein ROZALSC1DRAFT_28417, partial [Rozella allomycis CSF55]
MKNRLQTSSSRAAESLEQQELRLMKNRLQTSTSRAAESLERQELRFMKNREQTAKLTRYQYIKVTFRRQTFENATNA